MSRLLGLDIGTTGCKAIVIDESGKILEESLAEYPLLTPKPGWTEQHPDNWWEAVESIYRKLSPPFDAIGLTGQMHGSVFLDKKFRVLRPAILWNDQRTHEEVRELEDLLGIYNLYRITCNPPLTGFQAPKILWLKNHEPESFRNLHKVLLPKDYIHHKLTGGMFTDVSDASGTSLFDVPQRKWSRELLEKLDWNAEWFPESVESFRVTDKTEDGALVVGGAGDQAAGAVGTGAVIPGVISISLGTSGVVFTSQEKPDYDPRGRIHTFCHANGKWHSMSVMLSCGGALRWARETFGFRNYEEMAFLAEKAVDGGVVFKPYLAGERSPHNDPLLRASFHNLSLASGKGEIARAVFEGITFGLYDGFEVLNEIVGPFPENTVLRITGGGSKSDMWMQLIADVFRLPTVRLEMDEGPAYGAAILAGVGLGIWDNVADACKELVRTTRLFEPDSSRAEELRILRERWLQYPASKT
ncbi:MAG TPA: xylulokinase [Fimbriimonadales bacterium]|nr:xylulokinase [Fimbriimonadales bacterium]